MIRFSSMSRGSCPWRLHNSRPGRRTYRLWMAAQLLKECPVIALRQSRGANLRPAEKSGVPAISLRKVLSGTGDTDVMIRNRVMKVWNVHLWHVAGRALALADRARAPRMIG